MKELVVMRSRGIGWRRRVLLGAFLGGAFLAVLGAVALACTQRVGSLTVCRPPSLVFQATSCGKVTGTTQTGNVSVASSGSVFSVDASLFKSTRYNVTWRNSNTQESCHRVSANTVVLTSVAPSFPNQAAAGRDSFLGPAFSANFASPGGQSLGAASARVCAQDMPGVITGQVIAVSVI
ncbi:MAG: hypothetical protein ACRD0D_07245 [Acidimicrobiales bacterium]